MIRNEHDAQVWNAAIDAAAARCKTVEADRRKNPPNAGVVFGWERIQQAEATTAYSCWMGVDLLRVECCPSCKVYPRSECKRLPECPAVESKAGKG